MSDDITSRVPGAEEAGLVILLEPDDDPPNPREDHIATMVIQDGWGVVVDERDWRTMPDLTKSIRDGNEWVWMDWEWEGDWRESALRLVRDHRCEVVVISRRHDTYAPATDLDEQGLVGLIYMTPNDMRLAFNAKRCTGDVRRQARKLMRSEVEAYNQWANGDVWWIGVYNAGDYERSSINADLLESCGGYFGYEYAVSAAAEFVAPHLPRKEAV